VEAVRDGDGGRSRILRLQPLALPEVDRGDEVDGHLSAPSGERHEGLRDPTWGDGVEPEWAPHRHSGHPLDRQRASIGETLAISARARDVRARSRQSTPKSAGNL